LAEAAVVVLIQQLAQKIPGALAAQGEVAEPMGLHLYLGDKAHLVRVMREVAAIPMRLLGDMAVAVAVQELLVLM
jgi:hypothetical protein